MNDSVASPHPRPVRPRIVILGFGNHAAAEKRFAAGGADDYYAQRYTTTYHTGLVGRGYDVWTVFLGDNHPPERLPSGIRSRGLELYPRNARPRLKPVLDLLSALRPTHLILGSPLVSVIWWAVRRRVRVLPLLADSFAAADPKSRVRQFLLAASLNHPAVPWIANHGQAAARDLVRIGVPARKVLAFDWPAVVKAEDFPSKQAPVEGSSIRLIYVGQLIESKGLGDCIAALALLGPGFALTVVGKGDQEAFARQARSLGVEERVTFTGPIPHKEVLRLMHEHDLVVVPSRHEYPEGLPMTIYEGLCSRTPLVVSDHPMFRSKIVDGENGFVFRAHDPKDLARAVRALSQDRQTYRRLSVDAERVCRDFFPGPKWHEILDHWLGGKEEDGAWLASHTVAGQALA